MMNCNYNFRSKSQHVLPKFDQVNRTGKRYVCAFYILPSKKVQRHEKVKINLIFCPSPSRADKNWRNKTVKTTFSRRYKNIINSELCEKYKLCSCSKILLNFANKKLRIEDRRKKEK